MHYKTTPWGARAGGRVWMGWVGFEIFRGVEGSGVVYKRTRPD
jgi:hypothetical protein